MSKLETNTIDTVSGTSTLQVGSTNTSTITLGVSGDTINVPSGVTIANSGTATGFGEANTPAFEAYTTGLQSITDATFTKMTMATEVYDTDGNYASDRFTPQTAGKYFVYAKGFADPSNYGNLKNCSLQFYKNGSALSYTLYDIMPGDNSSANGGTGATPNARAVVDMNGSSDYLEVYFKNSTWNGSGAQVGSKQFGAYRIIT
jgi:hypothetical protein